MAQPNEHNAKQLAAAEAEARWAGFQPPPLPGAEAHERAIQRVRKMTPTQQRATLVEAGIYTKDGKLTAPYR
jgi:hypothetical protein